MQQKYWFTFISSLKNNILKSHHLKQVCRKVEFEMKRVSSMHTNQIEIYE